MKIYTHVLLAGLFGSTMASAAAGTTSATAGQVTVQIGGSSNQKLQGRAFQKDGRVFLLTGGNTEVFDQTSTSKKDGPVGTIDFASSSVRIFRNGDRLFVMSGVRILQFERRADAIGG